MYEAGRDSPFPPMPAPSSWAFSQFIHKAIQWGGYLTYPGFVWLIIIFYVDERSLTSWLPWGGQLYSITLSHLATDPKPEESRDHRWKSLKLSAPINFPCSEVSLQHFLTGLESWLPWGNLSSSAFQNSHRRVPRCPIIYHFLHALFI